MSRNYDLDDRPDRIELLQDSTDRVARRRPAGPADGCTGTPWCGCVDCDRVPAGGFFAFDRQHDHGEDWS